MWQRRCPGFKKGSKLLSVAVWCPFDCVKWMRCRRCFIGLGCELIIKIIRLDFVNIIYHTLSKGNRCSSAIINCVPCHQLEIKLMIPANKFNCCRSREKEKHFTLSWEVHKWEQTVAYLQPALFVYSHCKGANEAMKLPLCHLCAFITVLQAEKYAHFTTWRLHT